MDTENYTTIILNRSTIYRTEKQGQTHALWTDGKLSYSLSCYGLEWEEMVKIIEGIYIVETE